MWSTVRIRRSEGKCMGIMTVQFLAFHYLSRNFYVIYFKHLRPGNMHDA